MITAYQLMQRINTEYPNNGFVYDTEVTPESKQIEQSFLDYINSALLRMDKAIMLDDIYEFPTIAGQSVYELPLNCELGNIVEITRMVGNYTSIRLRWARDGEIMTGHRYYNGFGNTVGIFPTPTIDGEKITIFFKRTPMQIRTKDDPIEIADKWINLLVYSVVSDIASSGSNPDIEIANIYTSKYNSLLQEAILDKYASQPFYPKVKDNKRPPLSVFRRGRI